MAGNSVRDEDVMKAGDSNGNRSDSGVDGDHNGTASKPDSDRYGADSESDSDRYPLEDPELDEGLKPLIDTWKSMKEGWWNAAGYETYWDYVQESERGWARMGFASRLTELGYDALAQAARGFGLRPTTLARLLIHRGAVAVIEAQRSKPNGD